MIEVVLVFSLGFLLDEVTIPWARYSKDDDVFSEVGLEYTLFVSLGPQALSKIDTVSYTHLTLPTIYSV